MNDNKDIQAMNSELRQAVADIKTAILQGQYEAAKGVNRIQLAVYFGIGKYVSQHSRKGTWGTGALETISGQLRRELPGLRGYSATQMKEMRLFYEAWIMLDANSSVATDELENSASAIAEIESSKLSVAFDEFVEFMIRDYTKPMGVATYKTADEMPDNLRRALPSQEEHIKLMEGER